MTENRMDATSVFQATARRFAHARRDGLSLPEFPGELPATLEQAYAIQDVAIEEWPDEIRGWKVGRIQEPWLKRLGAERLVGPVFSRTKAKSRTPTVPSENSISSSCPPI